MLSFGFGSGCARMVCVHGLFRARVLYVLTTEACAASSGKCVKTKATSLPLAMQCKTQNQEVRLFVRSSDLDIRGNPRL